MKISIKEKKNQFQFESLQSLIFFKLKRRQLVNKGTFNLGQWMQMMIRLQEHKKQGFFIIFFNYDHLMPMTN